MASTNDIAVKVQDITKTFKIPIEASSGIKQKLINVLKGKKGYREFTPLNDISFEVKKGDFFGIVGRNGSGKSTLLKTIANIYTPTKGAVQVNGTLVPFIELGVGFNPELTGRENVFLNGALLGFSHKEMEAMYDDIVDFAEIGDFMDEKLKNYSSGMQVRLAFSIAIKAEGDILLLDEVLAVGDEAFQKKCYSYFAKLKKEKKTVILVTHDMGAVQQFCTKAMMIEKGKIVCSGDIIKVSHAYQELFMDENKKMEASVNEDKVYNDTIQCSVRTDTTDEKLKIEIIISPKINLDDVVLSVGLNRENGEQVFRWMSDDKLDKSINLRKGASYMLSMTVDNLFPIGAYTIGVRVVDKEKIHNHAIFDEIKKINIDRRKDSYDWDTLWVLRNTSSFKKL